MLDAAIVGGGLSGLALATLLRSRQVNYCVFEARSRLGGRVLTLEEPPRLVKDGSGLVKELPRLALDLGPTWLWPDDNPELVRLLRALGLATFEQHEAGRLVLARGDGLPPSRAPSPYAYASARRIVGGVGALIHALAARVGAERTRLGHELVRVVARDGFVELSFGSEGALTTVEARKVVLAMPPRLVHERVEFVPPLEPELAVALAETPTWMASHAKALAPFAEPFWRRRGDSGAALSSHPAAVLAEVFDACDSHQQAALGGFFALAPRERESRRAELPSLVRRELGALFGALPEDAPEPHVQDWASERFTAAALDLERPAQAPTSTPAVVRHAHWSDRLFFGGTETGSVHPGHLEGALEAALRLAPLLVKELPSRDSEPVPSATTIEPASRLWLESYRSCVQALRAAAGANYLDLVQQALVAHDSEGATQRALLQVAATTYRSALGELAGAPFTREPLDARAAGERLARVLAPFAGFGEELIALALKSNLTSCAIRNFPAEARPDSEYLGVIRADLQSVHEEFTRQVARRLG